jgi:hypothetical protein
MFSHKLIPMPMLVKEYSFKPVSFHLNIHIFHFDKEGKVPWYTRDFPFTNFIISNLKIALAKFSFISGVAFAA